VTAGHKQTNNATNATDEHMPVQTLIGIVCLLCSRSKWVSHLKIKLNYIYFLKWWQH